MAQALSSIGHQQLTAITNAAAQSLAMPANRNPCHAVIQAGAVAVRWRADGVAPTDTVGMLIAAGGTLDLTDPEGNYTSVLDKIQFISTGANSTLEVQYFE